MHRQNINLTIFQLLLTGFLIIFPLTLYGQKTAKHEFSASEARVLDLAPSSIVKPLIAEVVVDQSQGRIRDTWQLTQDEFNSRIINGDDAATIKNLQIYGVFKSTEKHNCDLIVAQTFDVQITPKGAIVRVVGYPANFTKWQTATKADMEWVGNIKFGNEQDTVENPKIEIK